MFDWYPQVGVSYNPIFSQAQFERFAEERIEQAAWLRRCATAAFACAAEWTSNHPLSTLNFECLVQTVKALIATYQVVLQDDRVNAAVVGAHINGLFWEMIGAAECLLRIQEEDDYLKNWDSGLKRGGCLARLLAELALAGDATSAELGEMIAALNRIGASGARISAYHLELSREVPWECSELISLASTAGALTMTVVEAATLLQARAALESHTEDVF
jgi:hypothetical protein